MANFSSGGLAQLQTETRGPDEHHGDGERDETIQGVVALRLILQVQRCLRYTGVKVKVKVNIEVNVRLRYKDDIQGIDVGMKVKVMIEV